MRRLLWFAFLFLAGWNLSAQKILDIRMNVQLEDVSLLQALNQLIDDHGVPLAFSDNLIPEHRINRTFTDIQIGHILEELFEGTLLDYRVRGSVIHLYRRNKPIGPVFTISGILRDSATGETLIGATVHDRLSGLGTESNEYGFYSLQLPAGKVVLVCSYTGYAAKEDSFYLHRNTYQPIALRSSLLLPLIEVLGSEAPLGITGGSSFQIDPEMAGRMPRLAGEEDPVRLLQLGTGVQTGTDGVEGLHVRGGNAGQNLVLVDGVPVYYAAHAAGVFSIFNSDAIRKAELIKGGFPAKYGGRLSSILDVRTKEGNNQKLSGKAEVGMISGRLSLEGPLVKGKSSFFLGGRWSYLNMFVMPFSRIAKGRNGVNGSTYYYFDDFNAKLNYSLGRNDKLFLSYYRGGDNFMNGGQVADTLTFVDNRDQLQNFRTYKSSFEQLSWSNQVGVLRWNHIYNDRLFSNVSLTYSELDVNSYFQSIDSIVNLRSGQYVNPFLSSLFNSRISDVGLRADFEYSPGKHNRHQINFGWAANYRLFAPGALVLDDGLSDAIINRSPKSVQVDSREYVGYFSDEIKLSKAWQLYAGVHLSLNRVEGKGYWSAQPRLGIYGNLTRHLGVKASLSHMSQFVHLLTNSSLGLPTDLWVPSTADISPETSWQGTVGLDIRPNESWELGLEAYYKKMDNLVTFTEGANYLYDWRNNLAIGKGTAKGIEVLLRRKRGPLTGWVAYTFSFTDRQFDRINRGKKYPFKFDRRHDFKLVMSYRFTPRFDISANWVISSGFAYNLASSVYRLNFPGDFSPPVEVPVYGEKNTDRMPDYHRMDIGANFKFGKNKIQQRLHVGVYNVYNKRNPLYHSFRTEYIISGGELRQRQRYVQVKLLPVLPSLSYSIQF
jgi:outer membrane receptor for ferrienterochelin and colicin